MAILGTCQKDGTLAKVLSIVATPIGNLGDITLRAMEQLKACDAIVCEDTRVTGKLLSLLNLPKKELIALHSHAHPRVLEGALKRLQDGQHLCLVSDAGTPGISDPGSLLIGKARELNLKIEVVPGVSAFLAALSASGLPTHRFTYLGFLPLKKGRQTLLSTFKDIDDTIVFYESPHRLLRTISDLAKALSSQPERKIVIARELTKLHEEVIIERIHSVEERIKSVTIKGEFVVLLGPATDHQTTSEEPESD